MNENILVKTDKIRITSTFLMCKQTYTCYTFCKKVEVSHMEKRLLKTAIYSFLIGFALTVIFVPIGQERIDWLGDVSTVLSYPDYFYMVFRYALMFTAVCVLVAYLQMAYRQTDKKDPLARCVVEWIIEPLKSLFIGFASVTMIGIVLALFIAVFLILFT